MRFFKKSLALIFVCMTYTCGGSDSSDVDHESGEPGEDGRKGDNGKTGADGEPARFAAIVDQNDTEVGYYLERVDFDNHTFEIMTIEGYRTVVDLDNASYAPPVQLGAGSGVSCMYTTGNCSGTCYGVDASARGYILGSVDGTSHYVDPNAATTVANIQSYNVNTALTACVVSAIGVSTVTPTQSYTGILTEDLSAPLYMKIINPVGD